MDVVWASWTCGWLSVATRSPGTTGGVKSFVLSVAIERHTATNCEENRTPHGLHKWLINNIMNRARAQSQSQQYVTWQSMGSPITREPHNMKLSTEQIKDGTQESHTEKFFFLFSVLKNL